MAALQCNEQLALKACFLGYTRRTSSLPFRLGESPRTTGRECRVRTRVDYPRESQLARQEAIPSGRAERRAAGRHPSALLVTQAVRLGAPTERGSFSARLLLFFVLSYTLLLADHLITDIYTSNLRGSKRNSKSPPP